MARALSVIFGSVLYGAVSRALAIPLVGVSLAPLGLHPTTGVDHGERNTLVFMDLFKHATPFTRYQPERDSYNEEFVSEYTSSRLPKFHQGYPTSLYKTSSYRISVKATIGNGGSELPAGRFVAVHDGNGTLGFSGDARLVHHEANTQSYVFDVIPSTGMVIRILATDESDILQNVRLYPEMYVVDGEVTATAPTFHPLFLSRLRGFSTLVFDGWFLMDDNGYNAYTQERSWADRPLPNQSTYNCFYTRDQCNGGVPIELAIELCNTIKATPWLTMPNVLDTSDSFALGMANLVHRGLDSSLSVAIQHRWGKGYGSFDAQRTNSLDLWDIFGGVFNGTRQLIRVVAGDYSTETLSRIGNDLMTAQAQSPNDVTLVTVPFSFGTQCFTGCVEFTSIDGAEYYENYTVADLMQNLQESVFYSESEWLADIARISKYTSGTAGIVPAGVYSTAIAAASYGWRDQVSRANRCVNARRAKTKLKDLYNTMEDALTSSMAPFYRQSNFKCVDWQLIGATVLSGSYNATSCTAACERAGNFTQCGGISFVNETGTCTLLKHPNSVWANSKGYDCYVRASWLQNQLTSFDQIPTSEELGTLFDSQFYCYTLADTYADYFSDDESAWGFDHLESDLVMGNLERLSNLEQSLEDRLMEAVGSDGRFEAIAVDIMARWLRLTSTSNASSALVTALPDVGPWQRLESGGKAGGASSLLQSPNISASKEAAAISSGRFGAGWAAISHFKNCNVTQDNVLSFLESLPESARLPAFTSEDDPTARDVVHCGSCFNGTCVNGTCFCWRGFRGEFCDEFTSKPGERPPGECLIALNGTTFGVNPSGISYWHRELTFVDVMKTSHADWTPQTHTDSTWNTGESVALRSDGYPESLGVDEAVGTMMLRDLDENAEDGSYVVRWDGDGVLECSLNVKSIVRGAGFMKCEMDFTTEFNNGLFVRIEWTNPFDPVRNVRVFLPGFDPGVIRSSNLSASAAGSWSVMPFHPRLLVNNI
jgi:hypothetical protein